MAKNGFNVLSEALNEPNADKKKMLLKKILNNKELATTNADTMAAKALLKDLSIK